MRISDWSSDVCSSDLHHRELVVARLAQDRLGLHRHVARGERQVLGQLRAHRVRRAWVDGVQELELLVGLVAQLAADAIGQLVLAELACSGLGGDRKSTRLNSSSY